MRDGKILIIENDSAFLKTFRRTCKTDFQENAEIVEFSDVEQFEKAAADGEFFDEFSLALVDLELGPVQPRGPGDHWGKERILPIIRAHGCWIPVVLLSIYISGDSSAMPLLADITPSNFDAVLAKGFLTTQGTNRKGWVDLKTDAALARIASLTGRTPHAVKALLGKNLNIRHGQGVKNALGHYDETTIRELFQLFDFGCDGIVLDEIVQGASGLTALMARTNIGAGEARWLVKLGTKLEKLDRELRAHRRLVQTGFARRMSVPVYWWNPVVWKSVGMLAYEFEDDASTFKKAVSVQGLGKCVKQLVPALRLLYAPCNTQSVIPRQHVDRIAGGSRKKNTAVSTLYKAVLDKSEHRELDGSVQVKVGAEHGDLHTTNILLSKRGPVLIDFAHFKGPSETGLPLMDCAKLMVDLFAWGLSGAAFEALINLKSLRAAPYRSLIAPFLVNGKRGPTSDEERLWKCAVICIAESYLRYPDVPASAKKEIKEVISKF